MPSVDINVIGKQRKLQGLPVQTSPCCIYCDVVQSPWPPSGLVLIETDDFAPTPTGR